MIADCKMIPEYARKILHSLTDAGFETYYAGGCVRDICIGIEPQDVDIASSATPEEVMSLFSKTVPTGIDHGTVTVCEAGGCAEVTAFRREGLYSDGRHPDRVTFGASPREDAARRDFTVNAIFMDEAGNLIDFENGTEDLHKGVIRAVGTPEKRFEEDGLRMIRAYRFCAKTGFSMDKKTEAAIYLCASRIGSVAPERICTELVKLLGTSRPEQINGVCKSGLLRRFGIDGELSREIIKAVAEPNGGKERLALFAAGTESEGIIPDGETFLHELRCDRETVELKKRITLIKKSLPVNRTEIKLALWKCGQKAVYTSLAFSKNCTRDRKLLSEILSSGECFSTSMLHIGGNEIGRDGAECGRILRALTEHCIRHPEDNCKEKLLDLLENYK